MKKKNSPEKKAKNSSAKLTDSRADQVVAYTEKGKQQTEFVKFGVHKEEPSNLTISIKEAEGEDTVVFSSERKTALYESTGMLKPHASTQLLMQIARCEDPQDATTTKAALEKASCMMMELQPQDAFEGLLISQMVACQNQAMTCLHRAASAQIVDCREMNLRFADRFMRTFAAQIETLAKYRRGGQQKVVVEHVHVHEGGQAIVGNIENHRGGGGDESKN